MSKASKAQAKKKRRENRKKKMNAHEKNNNKNLFKTNFVTFGDVPFGMMVSKVNNDTTFRMVGRYDVRDELELTDEEMDKIVESKVNFNFWWKGKDHRTGLKYTFDGDDVYYNLSLRNFFLANICDMYKGARIMRNDKTANLIESIEGLKKWLNFNGNRVTIKELSNEFVWEYF